MKTWPKSKHPRLKFEYLFFMGSFCAECFLKAGVSNTACKRATL